MKKKQKTKVKYDINRPIILMHSLEEYNSVGLKEKLDNAEQPHEYATRNNEAARRDTENPAQIDKKQITKQKKIFLPETSSAKEYLEWIEYKREDISRLNQKRGYKRHFMKNHLPDLKSYEATKPDFQFIEELKKNYPKLKKMIKFKNFEKIFEEIELLAGPSMRDFPFEKAKAGVKKKNPEYFLPVDKKNDPLENVKIFKEIFDVKKL